MTRPRVRVDIHLGAELRAALDAYCDEYGQTPSQVGRRAIAAYLGVPEPEITHGNLDMIAGGEAAEKLVRAAHRARWGGRR